MDYKIGIKDLVTFTCNSGDLLSELFENYNDQDGKKAHTFLQSKYNEESKKEYFIKHTFLVNGNNVTLDGYIDGLIFEKNKVIVEEIKSTPIDLEEIKEENIKSNYLAQLKVYAYLYMLDNNLENVDGRLIYIKVPSYQTKRFKYVFYKNDLEQFVLDIVNEYLIWFERLSQNSLLKLESIKEVKFPFPFYREGQRELIKNNYLSISDGKILYAIAPTGIGKTMATLFSTLKSIKQDNEKIFYLTAKNTGKEVAIDSIKLLMIHGLKVKTMVLTAKSKSCLNCSRNCDPIKCPYAIGYFDRLKDALYEIYDNYDIFTYDVLKEISQKHKICMFEFSLYLSYFSDIIICDYNYVFDPRAHLIRYFDDHTYQPKVLVDEAHNLIGRSLDMYSASFKLQTIRTLLEIFEITKEKDIQKDLKKLIEIIKLYQDKITESTTYFNKEPDYHIGALIERITQNIEKYLDDSEKNINNRDEILENYFELLRYRQISEFFNENYVFMVKYDNQDMEISINCLNASSFLLKTIKDSIKGITFFSATMYPSNYHMELLTQNEGSFIELESPFNKDNLDLIIYNKINTRFTNRSASIKDIIQIIEALATSKIGNYIVFFPSYQYMEMVLENINNQNYDIFFQKKLMNEDEREEFLRQFSMKKNRSQVGLFVIGGIFSEGIDYVGDLLSGVIVVSVCLPQINDYNNLLKDSYEKQYEAGFDFAYTYPGFNKVVQAVGRVIRTENDKGIAILLDERFNYNNYKKMFPKHWSNYKVIKNYDYLEKEINDFWIKNE